MRCELDETMSGETIALHNALLIQHHFDHV